MIAVQKDDWPVANLSSPPTSPPTILAFLIVLHTRPQNKDESHLQLGRFGHAEQRQRPCFAYRE